MSPTPNTTRATRGFTLTEVMISTVMVGGRLDFLVDGVRPVFSLRSLLGVGNAPSRPSRVGRFSWSSSRPRRQPFREIQERVERATRGDADARIRIKSSDLVFSLRADRARLIVNSTGIR